MRNISFHEYLLENSDKCFYIDWCKGNNGDLLISKGLEYITSKLEIKIVADIDKCDIVLINGGGMFVDGYKQGITKLEKYLNEGRKVCIAPNSFNYKKFDFSKFLEQYDLNLTIFVREKYSFKSLEKLPKQHLGLNLYLSHDLAFYLAESDFIKEAKKLNKNDTGNVLVVDRMDIENAKNAGKVSLLMKIYNNFIPEIGKVIYRKYRNWRRIKFGTTMTSQAKKIIRSLDPSYEFISVVSTDLSRDDLYSFDEFFSTINSSDYIFTNRLHVGVLGYLLGKNVYLIEGAYFKLTGIYELSMSTSDSVKLISKYEN